MGIVACGYDLILSTEGPSDNSSTNSSVFVENCWSTTGEGYKYGEYSTRVYDLFYCEEYSFYHSISDIIGPVIGHCLCLYYTFTLVVV